MRTLLTDRARVHVPVWEERKGVSHVRQPRPAQGRRAWPCPHMVHLQVSAKHGDANRFEYGMEAYGPPATAAHAGETPPSNGLLDARGHSVVNIAGMVEAKASASSRSCKNESSLCLQECGFSSFQSVRESVKIALPASSFSINAGSWSTWGKQGSKPVCCKRTRRCGRGRDSSS
jgi:hypothetical protein